mgnify:CR=1 FL=1
MPKEYGQITIKYSVLKLTDRSLFYFLKQCKSSNISNHKSVFLTYYWLRCLCINCESVFKICLYISRNHLFFMVNCMKQSQNLQRFSFLTIYCQSCTAKSFFQACHLAAYRLSFYELISGLLQHFKWSTYIRYMYINFTIVIPCLYNPKWS